MREEFLDRISGIGFGETIVDSRLLEIMRADPRCCGDIDLVKIKHGGSFMIMAGNVEVSYRTAIKRFLGLKHTRTRRTWIAAAARSTIQLQITEFRRRNKVARGMDIDHIGRDFCELWRDWLCKEGLDESVVKIRKVGRVFVLADSVLRKSWREYHRERAVLEPVSKDEHRIRTKVRKENRK